MKNFIPFKYLLLYAVFFSSQLWAQTWDAKINVAALFQYDADNTNGIKGTIAPGGQVKVTVKESSSGTIVYQVISHVSANFYVGTGSMINKSQVGSWSTFYPDNWDSKDIKTAIFAIDKFRYSHESHYPYKYLYHPLDVKIYIEIINAQLQSVKIPGIGIINSQGGNVLFDPQHYCYNITKTADCQCAAWLNIKQPKITGKSDLVAIAHRGIWGYNQGYGNPENSSPAINSTPAITNIMESDVMLLKDQNIVVSHDYNLNRTSNFSGASTTYLFDLNLEDITPYDLRKRNSDIDGNTHYLTFEDCINGVIENNILLTLDIKELKARYGKDGQGNTICLANCQYDNETGSPEANARADSLILQSYKIIFNKCVQKAKAVNGLSYLAVKVPYDFDEIKDAVAPEELGQILYFPVLQSNKSLAQSIQFVDSWINKAGNRLMGFETNFKDKNSVFLKPFEREGISYQNLWDYAYHKSGLRPACYPEEPMGQRGIVNRWAEWLIKDIGKDIRGDHYQLMSIPYSNIMMLTTDRPDIWLEIQKIYNK